LRSTWRESSSMSDANVIAGAVIIAAGLAFDLLGCVGLVRMPDVYTRLQAATKCVTLGTCLILIGAMVASGGGAFIAKGLLCIVFVLVTSPTAAHALARGAHRSGIKPSPGVVDHYEQAGRPDDEPSGENE